jgi:hypothetical protein
MLRHTGRAAKRPKHTAQLFGLALNMIIISESSAKAAQPVRTGRSAPVCSCSSAAHHDTHQQADAQRISVHTEVITDSIRAARYPLTHEDEAYQLW